MVASPYGIADGGRLGHPLDEPHRQRRVGQRSPAPGQRDAEEGIAEAPGEHVRHLVPQARRREVFLHEHLARPGLGVERLPGADQRLLHLGVREVPHGDRQLGLDAERLVELLVAELQVLDLQRPLGAALGSGHGVDDEVRGGLGLTELAGQIVVGDVKPQPAPEPVERERRRQQRDRRDAAPRDASAAGRDRVRPPRAPAGSPWRPRRRWRPGTGPGTAAGAAPRRRSVLGKYPPNGSKANTGGSR